MNDLVSWLAANDHALTAIDRTRLSHEPTASTVKSDTIEGDVDKGTPALLGKMMAGAASLSPV